MLINITFYQRVRTPQGIAYEHQDISVNPSAVKWVVNNKSTKITLKLTNGEVKRNYVPNTRAFIEGYGEILLKEERLKLKAIMS